MSKYLLSKCRRLIFYYCTAGAKIFTTRLAAAADNSTTKWSALKFSLPRSWCQRFYYQTATVNINTTKLQASEFALPNCHCQKFSLPSSRRQRFYYQTTTVKINTAQRQNLHYQTAIINTKLSATKFLLPICYLMQKFLLPHYKQKNFYYLTAPADILPGLPIGGLVIKILFLAVW